MAENQKAARVVVVGDEDGATPAPAGNRPGSGLQKSRRTTWINGREFPVDFSKRDPTSGVIYDYVKMQREVTAFVPNESTGLLERRKVLSVFHRKVGRAAEPRESKLVDVTE